MALKFTSNELVEIGRRVQDARVAKRMTQEYVADQCDCTTKHISDIERGVVGPSFPVKNGQTIRYGRGLLSV